MQRTILLVFLLICLVSVIAETQESLEFTENNLDAEKRVFCNAFTGCGKKRSVTDKSSVDSKTPEKVKRAFFLPSLMKKLIHLTLKMKNNLSLLQSAQERNEELENILSYLSNYSEEIQA
ncbi:hypothetical protein TNCT_28561 [Trichonephila clavata]|uniref:Uncharacterized protein n=1 Tax=Trichonephila clavata TaxID=2740835 RepID=A0A8X6JJK1_TRICU|nr:hypothetical protein TNCT_28561 [Trichonephila clavata]